MDYNSLIITIKQAESILLKRYQIQGKAYPLPGEIDFNFRINIHNKDTYILKISRPKEDLNYIDFQQQILKYLENTSNEIISPKVILDKNNKEVCHFIDEFGNYRYVRMLTWISGRIWSDVNPQLSALRFSLGEQCGKLVRSLQGFKHPKINRSFDWDIAQSLWTKKFIHLFNKEEKEIISFFQNNFESHQKTYIKLRKSVVHNDINNNNIIVNNDLNSPSVRSIIDFGDTIHTQIINDLAITLAYTIPNQNDPLEAALPIIKGFHHSFPLQEEELIHLYSSIGMRLIISVIKSALGKIKEPGNKYLLISEKPSWDLLKKWFSIPPDLALYSFRKACEFTAHPNEKIFQEWAGQNPSKLSELFPDIKRDHIFNLDLSVSSKWIGHQHDLNDLELFDYKVNKLQKEYPDRIIAGGYLEPRAVYTNSAYDKIGNNGKESRTIHLGIDFWLPEDIALHALFDGEIVTSIHHNEHKDYGGLITIKHSIKDFEFFTLYGHLSATSIEHIKAGDQIKKGETIGHLGKYTENGNWAPHLHFQILLSLLDQKNNFPGVAYPNQTDVWKSLCPDPNLIFNSKELSVNSSIPDKDIIVYRNQHLGKNLSLQYNTPIQMVRGAGAYLIDQLGNKYLDTVNNVAHVGHENYTIAKAGQEQMALINTNTRYLHKNIIELAKELLKTLPPEISTLHFVNSGSEANDLAIRMAKTATGQQDIIASEVGYHGNTNACIDISSYKFDGKGGKGKPEHTHIFPLPDSFRGKYRGDKSGDKYANEVLKIIKNIPKKDRGVCAFIVEPVISCGGQIELPKGFLKKVYHHVKTAGGICISDEVQVGLGRLGKSFWGFELHDVIPDIITIGKPLGNGHPIAAVACTKEVAEKFNNGMEYFNTFGGNPVSCAIATEVLRTIKREKLQENALKVGEFLKFKLVELQNDYPIIGQVRGQGLFLGIELTNSHLRPLAHQTTYLVERMKNHGILMSIDGPDHNVIKIKPPLVFNQENAEELLFYLRKIFKEDYMQITD